MSEHMTTAEANSEAPIAEVPSEPTGFRQSNEPRYKGTSPYEDKPLDRKTFFGRDFECRSLLNLVLAEDLVILFAKSGMGKTSLIKAGLMEQLRELGYFPAVARVNDTTQDLVESVVRSVQETASAANVDCVSIDQGSDNQSSLSDYFGSVEYWSAEDDLLRPALILDQFEELFTLQTPLRRKELIARLADLVRAGKERAPQSGGGYAGIKVVISMREDFLANLEELASDIPGILRNRFRLGPLSRDGARDAIVEPALVDDDAFTGLPFTYQQDAVERIIAFLGKQRLGTETIEVDEVEPVQLQLICQYVEEQVQERRANLETADDSGPDDGIEVSGEDLGDEKHMQRVLRNFYERTIGAIELKAEKKAVQRLCEERLISPSGRRLTEDGDEIVYQFGILKQRLRQLVDARLLRSEPRLGGTFYELSHDTLVAPILAARAERLARRNTRRKWMSGIGTGLAAIILLVIGYVGGQQLPPLTDYPRLMAVLFREPPSEDDAVLRALEQVRRGELVIEYPSGSSPAESQPISQIIAIRRLLVFLGYSTGYGGEYILDGDFGLGTLRGIAQFQVENEIQSGANLDALLVNRQLYLRRVEALKVDIVRMIDERIGRRSLLFRRGFDASRLDRLPEIIDRSLREDEFEISDGIRDALIKHVEDQNVFPSPSAGRDMEQVPQLAEDIENRIIEEGTLLDELKRVREAEDSLRSVVIDAGTIQAMLENARIAIDDGNILFGSFEPALNHLNSLAQVGDRLLDRHTIVNTYEPQVLDAVEAVREEFNLDIRPEWVYAAIDVGSSGFPRLQFHQDVLSEQTLFYSREERLNATTMGLGGIFGRDFDLVGAAHAEDMFSADLNSQIGFIARSIANGITARNLEPNSEDFYPTIVQEIWGSQAKNSIAIFASAVALYLELTEEKKSASASVGLDDPDVVSVLVGPRESGSAALQGLRFILAGDITDPRSIGGPTVTAIQRLLIFLGYSTSSSGAYVIDGQLGAGVNRAIAQFRYEAELVGSQSTDGELRTSLTYPCTFQTCAGEIAAIPTQPTDRETLRALLDEVVEAIRTNQVMIGSLDEALFTLNSIHYGGRLSVEEIYDRYGASVDRAVDRIVDEKGVEMQPEWLLALIKQNSAGIPRPRFEQHFLSRLSRNEPDVEFRELRLRSTTMGFGQMLGDIYPRVGASSAGSMFTSPLDEQMMFLARFLGQPRDGAVGDAIAKTDPQEEDFRTVARYFFGPGFKNSRHDETLAQTFREFRQIRESGQKEMIQAE